MSRIGKEKPEFFDGDREYYYVNIDTTISSEVKRYRNFLDRKDSRTEERSAKDHVVGTISEIATKVFLEERGNEVEISEDWEYDLLVNGHNRVEVKTRDYSQTASKYKDLLVRDRKDTDWSPSDVDYIIQAMINGEESNKCYITGYCTGRKAENAEFFKKARTYRTKKVLHENLTSFDEKSVF